MKRVGFKLWLLVCLMSLLFTCSVSAKSSNDKKLRKLANYGRVAGPVGSNTTKYSINGSKSKKINLKKWGIDGSLKYFHGMFNTVTHEGYVSLAEKLSRIAPVRGDRKAPAEDAGKGRRNAAGRLIFPQFA